MHTILSLHRLATPLLQRISPIDLLLLTHVISVFLGYHVDPESPWHVYPVLKVGDWGLAKLTNEYDPENPRRFMERGTRVYLPPVSRRFHILLVACPF
jgi:hypothetical protein